MSAYDPKRTSHGWAASGSVYRPLNITPHKHLPSPEINLIWIKVDRRSKM